MIGNRLFAWQIAIMYAGRLALVWWRDQINKLRTACHFGDPANLRHCPCCDRQFIEWTDWSRSYRKVGCPYCGSHPRHRHLWLYLNRQPDIRHQRLRLLHFAPEPALRVRLKAWHNLDYVTANITGGAQDAKIDITAIPYPDNSFDIILCSHVLEHVPDDHQAMRELLRVLKPGGWANLQVPIDFDRAETFEDPTIVTPRDRLRHYWQEDHVRLYGRDYRDRLEAAGFRIELVDLTTQMDPSEVARLGLRPPNTQPEPLFLGFKR